MKILVFIRDRITHLLFLDTTFLCSIFFVFFFDYVGVVFSLFNLRFLD